MAACGRGSPGSSGSASAPLLRPRAMFSGIVGDYGAAPPAADAAHAHSHGGEAHAHGGDCGDAACGHAHGAPAPARVVLARGDADGRCARPAVCRALRKGKAARAWGATCRAPRRGGAACFAVRRGG